MLVMMWGKRNPHTLLVGIQASTTTLENNGGGGGEGVGGWGEK
jgi:hypothetical protein